MPSGQGGTNPQQYSSFEQLMAQRYQQAGSRTSGQAPSSSDAPGAAAGFTPSTLQQQKKPPPLSAPPAAASSPSTQTVKSNSSKSGNNKKDNSKLTHTAGLQYNTPQQQWHLNHIDWKDKIIWAARLILGGNSINGFQRAAATAQRIKKQRARQSAITKKSAAAAAAAAAGTTVEPEVPKEKPKGFDADEEEKLKKEIMNPRTAKKIKAEFESGLQFCAVLHNLLRGIVLDLDPDQAPFLPQMIKVDDGQPTAPPIPSHLKLGAVAHPQPPNEPNIPWPVKANTPQPAPMPPKPQRPAEPPQPPQPKEPPALPQPQPPKQQQKSEKTTVSPGNSEGSTLRKNRKKKLPPNREISPNVPEFDGAGKRLCNKKEHSNRIFESLRFRPLKQGDFVAARTTSRDLWILARVLKDYAGFDIPPLDFLQLTGSRRDALFREKVLVKDVEDKEDGGSSQVARNLILPLPRTYSEAAEWATRGKKGSRVYAMYPQTTSLYSATVIDNSTYCRGDDDIIVVEFDGEEPDATGKLPQYHIPARFVTLIPREFPASQPPSTNSGSNKRKGGPATASAPPAKKQNGGEDALLMDFDGGGLGNFDSLDLDFDKPLEGVEEEDIDFNF